MGGVRNGAAEEDWCWDLNPSMAAMPGEDHTALAEWGPHGGNTADGAGNLNHRLPLLFLRHGTPDWARGEGRTVGILKDLVSY